MGPNDSVSRYRPLFFAVFLILRSVSPAAGQGVLDRTGEAFGSAGRSVGRAGEAVGGFFRSIGDALFGGREGEEQLERALRSYTEGRTYTTYRVATELRSRGDEVFRDEAELLRSLSALPPGLRNPALASLERVLEQRPVSPYYPVALAHLIDLQTSQGHRDAAVAAARRYFVEPWTEPRTEHQATIKGLFLSYGSLLASKQPQVVTVQDLGQEPAGRRERPADRAVYQAGRVFYAAEEFRQAAICFEAFGPESVFYPYARFALAQTHYALGNFRQARSDLEHVHAFPAQTPGETVLKDRAALALARIAHELDEDDAAIRWLAGIPKDGPFALQSAMLAAEIFARRDEPALALVYLDDADEAPAEPKLAAQAALLRAQLELMMDSHDAATETLRSALKQLDAYAAELDRVLAGDGALEKVLALIEQRRESRAILARAKRRNLANAIPSLVDFEPDSSWVSTRLARWTRDEGNGVQPVVYYRQDFDLFNALPVPEMRPPDPPRTKSAAAVFRASLESGADRVLEHRSRLEEALNTDDLHHLALLLVETEARLRSRENGASRPPVPAWVHELGFPPRVVTLLEEGAAPRKAVAAALDGDAGEITSRDGDRLRQAGRDLLERWATAERELLRDAARMERDAVRDRRYGLERGLSEALTVKRRAQEEALRSQQRP